MSKSNPYAPSAIKLRFALASSLKYLVLPSSFTPEINSIKGASIDLASQTLEEVLDLWKDAITKEQKDRVIRYMVTGNILQGLGRYSGKMVSYTTNNDTVEKGILLQEHYSPNVDDEVKGVVVPLSRALNFIVSQGYGKIISLSHGISVVNQNGEYTIRYHLQKKKEETFI